MRNAHKLFDATVHLLGAAASGLGQQCATNCNIAKSIVLFKLKEKLSKM